MGMKTGFKWREYRSVVAERIDLDSTERSCNLVVVAEGSRRLADNPAYHMAGHRRTQPERRRTRHRSLAEVDDNHLAAAEGWCWFAKPRDGAKEGCWIRLR